MEHGQGVGVPLAGVVKGGAAEGVAGWADLVSSIEHLVSGGRVGYAFGFSFHIVANMMIATTAQATMVYITINHAVSSEYLSLK